MAWQETRGTETLKLKLVAAERKLIVESTGVQDMGCRDCIRQTPRDQDVELTPDEWEDLHEALVLDADRTDDRLREQALERILRKIEGALDEFEAQQSPQDRDWPADVPEEFRELHAELTSLTDDFCRERLNDEYLEMCRRVAMLLCQEGSPAVRGKRESWASGIVSAVGMVNFLTDPTQDPHVRSEDVAKWFGVSTGTMQSKSKTIRDGLDMFQLDPDFTLPSRLDANPLVWMFDVGGLILDIRAAPREIQAAAFKAGDIPYIPADRAGGDGVYAVTHERIASPAKKAQAKPPSKHAGYQIKITLDGSRPAIWRRLRVPNCDLETLHGLIQTAMGWQDGHLHEFSAGDERFVMAEMYEFDDRDDDAREEADVLLSELVAAGHKKLQYWYDFGDDWRHTIKIEKTLELRPEDAGPACLAGAGACPPEDIGGVWGYAEFLEAMADPQHERHEELKDWYGDDFEPTRFDLEEVNGLLRG